MVYDKLEFPKIPNRPFIFSDFVMTMDGKVWVKKDGYWPIGSKTDYETFTYLRAHADAIIDGKGTALAFGHKSFETFTSDKFREMRKKLGRTEQVEHIILTKHPDHKIREFQEHTKAFPPTIFTEGLDKLIDYLNQKEYKTVFINGGPTLVGSLIEKHMLDELFITIAPKIFGNDKESVITMVEGQLYKPDEIKKWKLVSAKPVEDEVYLRYRKP